MIGEPGKAKAWAAPVILPSPKRFSSIISLSSEESPITSVLEMIGATISERVMATGV